MIRALVDCGVPDSWASLQRALSQLGRRASDVRGVVLTHAHFDHVGFAERARRVLGVPVVVLAGDALVTLDPYTGRTGPRLVARAATVDSDRNLASLDALSATGAKLVLTGHGEPWRTGVEAAVTAAKAAPVA